MNCLDNKGSAPTMFKLELFLIIKLLLILKSFDETIHFISLHLLLEKVLHRGELIHYLFMFSLAGWNLIFELSVNGKTLNSNERLRVYTSNCF